MPRPFSTVHDAYILKYLRLGKGKQINTTRTILAQNGANELFPIRINFRETPPSADDTAPRFCAFMLGISTDEGYVLFSDEQQGFQVFAGCARSYALMGLDYSMLMEQEASIVTWFPAVDPEYEWDMFAGGDGAVDSAASHSKIKF